MRTSGIVAGDCALVISTVALQVVIGFGLALLINRQFRSHSFWTTIILLPMMLFAGRGRQLLDLCCFQRKSGRSTT